MTYHSGATIVTTTKLTRVLSDQYGPFPVLHTLYIAQSHVIFLVAVAIIKYVHI